MPFSFSKLLSFSLCVLATRMSAAAPGGGTALAGSKTGLVARVMTLEGMTESTGARGDVKTPLGSLYKLFVLAYLEETGAPETPYACRGNDPEEIFCCHKTETIDRQVALARSCSPYFSHTRLGIDDRAWSSLWRQKFKSAPAWLLEPGRLKPDTVVYVDDLLRSLLAIRTSFASFHRVEAATLGTVTFGTAANALKTWGSMLRVKTFTWRDDETRARTDERGFTGGFAGWLPDGSAIWVSQAGHGRDAFQSELKSIVEAHPPTADSGCVLVRYFDRYPIASLTPGGERPRGKVRVKFKNGQQIEFAGDGTLRVDRQNGRINVSARLATNDYVARVLEREVKTKPVDAARAFAIAIRTYLQQNAKEVAGCHEITDSSHHQRVSPNAPGAEALALARWSDGLVLDHVSELRYHSSREGPNRMSWPQAEGLALSGFSMPEILKTAYPAGVIKYGIVQSLACTPNAFTSRWITDQAGRWKKRLNAEAGFEWPERLRVCQSPAEDHVARVFADLDSQEIFVPRLRSTDEELSVLHEYLHIGFRNHPRGRDEAFIEKLARVLQEDK